MSFNGPPGGAQRRVPFIIARHLASCFALLSLFLASDIRATIFGSIHGTVRDAAHRPIKSAAVTLRAETAQWHVTTSTDAEGRYAIAAIPLGDYRIGATAPGLAPFEERVAVNGGASLDVDLDLPVAAISEQVEVSGAPITVDPRSSTTQTTISRAEIARTPGADDANSLGMITSFVPGAYMVHDQLHVRGGHQVDWLVDGVAVPNTNIASNVGPQFDPRDVDYIEVHRGGYSAEYGDRTYAVFNVVPRSGFERKDEAGLIFGLGSQSNANVQGNIGSHTDRFAYYASLNTNRSSYGLETPVAEIIHDSARGAGGFLSLDFQQQASDQFRLVASSRTDRYDIPNDQDAAAAGVRDEETERDAFVNASWLHIIRSTTLLTVSPFFHRNTADFDGGPNDPIVATDHRTSQYAGGQITLAGAAHGHDARIGAFGFAQRDTTTFGLRANDGSGVNLTQKEQPDGNVAAAYVEDAYDIAKWLTFRAGLRYTRFSADLTETATDPRLGLAARLPWSNAVLRASYGQFYQAPPLSTISGPLLDLAILQGFAFLPLHGERDRQAEVGLAVPVAGWTFDAAAFRTHARNFFDHDVLGDSNIFFPLTIDRAFIHGVEATITSPRVAQRADLHVAFSHQTVQGEGAVVGGLTAFQPPPDGRFLLDHDQRTTVSVGGTLRLPKASWLAAAVAYGSGFLEGNGPGHLPPHTTFDLSAGTVFGDWSARIAALNAANKRYLLDESNTFGGTHYASPRQISAQIGYRFHY
jgi:outer membrane cobalamin receptor